MQATEKQAKADSHGSQGPASASQRSQPGVAVSKKPRMHIAVVQQQQQLQQQQAGSHQDSGSQAADDFLEMLLAGPKSSNRSASSQSSILHIVLCIMHATPTVCPQLAPALGGRLIHTVPLSVFLLLAACFDSLHVCNLYACM